MKGKLFMFYTHISFYLYLIVSQVYNLLRAICWQITGRAAEIREAQSKYETSAHVTGFFYKHTLDILFSSGTYNFLRYHESFTNPEFVLRDDVTLLQVTPKEAVFLQHDPKAEPPHSSVYSFFFNGQFQTAKKVITMPLESFLKLSEATPDEGAKIVLLYNQARCGSTLVTSIFEHTNRCVTFSEPHSLNYVSQLVANGKTWSPDKGRRIFRATLRMLCKPYHGLPGKVLAYVIKPTAPTIAAASLIQEAIPDSIPLFLYRDPVSVATSARRLAEALQSIKMMYYLMEFRVPNIVYISFSIIGMICEKFKGWTPRSTTGLELGYRLAMVTLKYRDELASQGVSIPAIRFEDLRGHPKEIITKIMKLCDLPSSLIDPALEAMKQDSQHATVFSMKKLRELIPESEVPKATPEFLAEMAAEAKEMGVPAPDMWTEDRRLDNSILP